MGCALCGRKRDLCKSHILSEFLYEPLYDKVLHRYNVVSTDPKVRSFTRPTGSYERLLCEECEGLIGSWESYAKPLLYGGIGFGWARGPHGPIIHDIDYSRFKLFQMSMLWKCHVTTLQDFRCVDLGPKHGERLRSMLLASNPGKPKDYGCVLFAAPKMTNCTDKLILLPERLKIDGQTSYILMAGQIFWIYFVFSPAVLPPQKDYFLDASGTLPILINDEWTSKYLAKYAKQLKATGKLD